MQQSLARAQHRASDALATIHLPQMPSRDEILAGARVMFAKTPSLDEIVDRAHDRLLAAVGARLLAEEN
jgi:stearoyl-CoA desaturase (delta-9 desaturase)